MAVIKSTERSTMSISSEPTACWPERHWSSRFSTLWASSWTVATPSAPALPLMVWNGRKTSFINVLSVGDSSRRNNVASMVPR